MRWKGRFGGSNPNWIKTQLGGKVGSLAGSMSFVSRLFVALPIGLAYFAAVAVSLTLTRYDGGVAFLWFAASIMIAALRVRPRSEWLPVVVVCGVASAVGTGFLGLGWAFALPLAAINMIEGLLGAELLTRGRARRAALGTPGWLLEFIVPIGIVAPAVMAALLGIVFLWTKLDPVSAAIHAFCGHALGNLAFTPLTRLIALGGFRSLGVELLQNGKAEMIGLLSALAIVGVVVFGQHQLPLLFLPVLPMILIAFRLGFAGSAVSVVIIAVIGGIFTLIGQGPLHLIAKPLGFQMQFLQFYLASIVVTALPVAADVKNRADLHRAMRLSEERYRLMAEHSTDILMHLEMDGSIRYVSPAMEQITGFDPNALIGTFARNLVPLDQRPILLQGHLATLAARGATHSIEYIALTKGGGRIWLESRARALMDDKGEIESSLCIVRDVSDRKEKELRLSVAAMTDPLTGLANRRAFEAAVAARTAERKDDETDCIALFDIDLFKRVNDTYGHDAGDVVLRGFAKVLSGAVRHNDTVARIGGEEFAVLFPNSSIPNALMICERIRQEMAQSSVAVGGQAIRVTVSGGVALLREEGIERALKQADQALYAAKRGGRDQMALAA